MGCIERRVGTWVDMVGDLITWPIYLYPRRALASQMYETFQCEVSWTWLNRDGTSGFVLHTPIPGWPPPGPEADMVNARINHPLILWFAATGDTAAMSIGRVPPSLITSKSRVVVGDHLAPIGMEEQLSIPNRFGRDQHRAFILARTGGDFSAGDLRVARELQPLLRLVDRQCRVLLEGVRANGSNPGLTGRELAVLRLLSEGRTASSIACGLGISPRTVHRHLDHVYRKLGVTDRVRAVLVATEAGLLMNGRAASSVMQEATAPATDEPGLRGVLGAEEGSVA